MTRDPLATPAAFRGRFRNFGSRNQGQETFLEIAIDRAQLGHALVRLGCPPFPDPWNTPEDQLSVGLVPCRFPHHPDVDAQVLGEGMLLALTSMVESGELPLTTEIAVLFDALREVLDGTPIHVPPMPVDSGDN